MRKKTVVVGFDGFIDILAKPIIEKGENGNRYFDTIASFGEYIRGRAGKSCSIEMDILKRKMGGNAPLFSAAAATLPFDVSCIGMLGLPEPLPLFDSLPFKLYSYLPPGESTALEFDDGKIFLAPSLPFMNDPWIAVNTATENRAEKLLNQADVIALLNWSEIPFAYALWESALVSLSTKIAKKEKYAMFDLCDCSRKPREEIKSVLELIGRFSQLRYTVLSLNENECLDIGGKLFRQSECAETAKKIYADNGIDEVVVHSNRHSLVVNSDGTYTAETIFVEKPLVSTGAGDNFNAAYAYGTAAGFPLAERLEFCHRFVRSYITSGKSGFLPMPVMDETGIDVLLE